MSRHLSEEITVTPLPDGVHFRLPGRQLGGFRFVGLAVMAFGVFFTGFATFWISAAASAVPWGDLQNPAAWFALLFPACGIPFVLAGLGVMGTGLLLLAGHSEIELRGGTLRAIERCGLVRWSWKKPAAGVCRFVVQRGLTGKDGQPLVGPLAELAVILPQWEKTPNPRATPAMWLAPGYARSLLLPLAEELARRSQAVAEEVSPSTPPVVEVVEQRAGAPFRVTEEVLEQPKSSKVLVEESPAGVTFRVPPAGLLGPQGCLFLFGLLWCGMLTVFTTMMFIGGVKDKQGNPAGWEAGLFISVFWLVGAGVLLGAVSAARRRAVLAVVGDELLTLESGLFLSKERRWLRAKLGDISVGPSGTTVNNRPVMELQVQPKEGAGKVAGLLGGRDEAELEWLASRLRHALQLQPVADDDDDDDSFVERREQPVGSAVVVERTRDSITLTVPPAGIWRAGKAALLFGLLWCGFIAIFDTVVLFAANEKPGQAGPYIMLGFSLLFWAVGIGILLSAVNMGRRRAVLAVVADELLVLQTGLFGSKRWQWLRRDLADIRTGPSNTSVNNVPVRELQIQPREGEPVGLLAGREDAELQWLATELRRALRVPEPETAPRAQTGE